jgi:hypothetical protein
MSKRHKDKGRIGGPFVPLLKETLASDAWRTMEPSSRLVYIALKARYGIELKNNGRIYLSARTAALEIGISFNTARRAFHELLHYGFIVMTAPGFLGVNGRGKAPHWRLTELGYMNDPPTKDFLRWDGVLFTAPKNRIPTQPLRHPDATTASPLTQPLRHSAGEVTQPLRHTDDPNRRNHCVISRVTTPPSAVGPTQGNTKPVLSPDDWRRNSKTAAERLDVPDDLSIPPFLRRALN